MFKRDGFRGFLRFLVLGLVLSRLSLSGAESGGESGAALSFNREVRPILAGKCYECHGPDEESRKGDLRLDLRSEAERVLGADGEFLIRITSTDPDEKMPPPKSHRTLEAEELEVLKRWVEQGAEYEQHWAFVPPVRPELPSVKRKGWVRNEVDRFVLHRVEQQGFTTSPPADPYTLVRRVYLDLIGIPPTWEQVEAFVSDTRPDAYERLVGDLLQSKHYGIRWARQWLDLARYADTNGYEKDRPRSIWPYRDWVVEALNRDMPYDRFTIEQLAGDMLPGATRAQRIATGFHRNTMVNEEGGIDPLEYRYYAMVDRVATTGTVWMGLTTGCAQCHTHKYDPITHTDYFSLMALLNNADEVDLDVPTEEVQRQRAALRRQIAEVEKEGLPRAQGPAYQEWLAAKREQAVPWTVLRPVEATSGLPRLKIMKDGSVFARGDFTKRDVYRLRFQVEGKEPVTALRLEVLPDARLPAHGPGIGFYEGRRGDFFLSEVSVRAGGTEVKLGEGSVSFGKISVGSGDAKAANVLDGEGSTGWSTSTREGERHHLVLNLVEPIRSPAELEVELLFERHFAAALGRFRFDYSTAPKKAVAFASDAPDFLRASEDELQRFYIRTAEPFGELQKRIAALERKMPAIPSTLVMRERPSDNPRSTFRHHRGEYLSAREEVSPGVPEIFPPLRADEAKNRLSLARWLISERNPLAARVAVNRAWQAMFGRGLVVSAEDFGTQAEAPTHPKLLDWLACEFVERGWSLKELHRLLVTSATYRQSSVRFDQLADLDPDNRWWGRGPRFRLEGESVRDSVLQAAGLLSDKMGGPGVYPPQPASVTELAYGRTAWKPSAGEDRFRRSLYTFSKRTAPFAAYTVFDAPTGETCVARRDRSNTPLQALTLLNDSMYLEMARALAAQCLKAPGGDRERAAYLFRRCLSRDPDAEEVAALTNYVRAQRERLEAGELKAEALLKTESPDVELAAWMLVARAVLNLDEMITKG